MEETLYGNTSNTFLPQWLKLKSELLKTERILLRTTRALDSFMDVYTDRTGFPINKYSDIHEHLERIMRTAALQLSKLDDLYNFYNAQSNDRMNRMVYILTIISAIFLPLNLIVGFFGMNTSDLPFTTHANGTYFALSLLVLSLALTSVLLLFSRK
jgi:magnesium transporter